MCACVLVFLWLYKAFECNLRLDKSMTNPISFIFSTHFNDLATANGAVEDAKIIHTEQILDANIAMEE